MNRILESELSAFCLEYNIRSKEKVSTKFEHFVNYLYFLNNCPHAYGTERDAYLRVHTGKGGDNGIDGILIVINDTPVFSLEEAKNLVATLYPKSLYVDFYFTQAKTSDNFEIGDMLKTREGVKHFFGRRQPGNKEISNYWKIQDFIFEQAARFKSNPTCNVAFATTGKWLGNDDQRRFVEDSIQELKELNLFSDVKWESIDGNNLQKLYKNLNNTISKRIPFKSNVPFPDIPGVTQSHVGLVDGDSFIDLITIDGKLNKSIFYENVRAFLGDNYVNKEIAETLINPERRKLFPILNNGITIVARDTKIQGENLTIQDFQIVNGCQTSNVLFNNRHILENVMIPVKIIASENQDVINMIIRSTNRQTNVEPEAFESIKDIHKKIQNFYNTYSMPDRIYYQRRIREYDKNNREVTITQPQIFTIPMQLMSHVAMFIGMPHLVEHEYYGSLLRSYGKNVFQDSDNPIVYYTSARTLYKVEEWIHNLDKNKKSNVKAYRFQFLLIIRRLISNQSKVPPLNSGKIEKLCEDILKKIEDPKEFRKLIKEASDILTEAVSKSVSSNGYVDHVLLTAELNYIIDAKRNK